MTGRRHAGSTARDLFGFLVGVELLVLAVVVAGVAVGLGYQLLS